MTKYPILKKIRKPTNNTKTPPKTSITQRLRTDLGWSVGVTTVIQLVWLSPCCIADLPPCIPSPRKVCNIADLPPEDLQHCIPYPRRSATLQTFPQGGLFATLQIFSVPLQIFPGGGSATLQTFLHFCKVPDSYFRRYRNTGF